MIHLKLSRLYTQLFAEVPGHLYGGHIQILGGWHHIRFIRVKEGDVVEPLDGATEQVLDLFNAMQKLNEGAFERVTVPGLEGQYVMAIYPFAE